MTIPLEDTFADVVRKAQRGLGIPDGRLATLAGISSELPGELDSGAMDPGVVRELARALSLQEDALIALSAGTYKPAPVVLPGLETFNTPFEDMTVNNFLVWDAGTREAAAFDTGADATNLLAFLNTQGLALRMVFLTHTHGDHILELDRIREATGAPAFVGDREPRIDGTAAFPAGKSFRLGGLAFDTRLTWGHARGGITYMVSGLEKPLAVVGDAVFAGSMGGGAVSYADALRTNREEIMSLPDDTVLACGHGPLTTVGEQRRFNPFLAH